MIFYTFTSTDAKPTSCGIGADNGRRLEGLSTNSLAAAIARAQDPKVPSNQVTKVRRSPGRTHDRDRVTAQVNGEKVEYHPSALGFILGPNGKYVERPTH